MTTVTGAERRDKQLGLFEINGGLFLEITRGIARLIASRNGTVTADAVRRDYHKRFPGQSWGNAAGAIFKDDDFEFTGEYRHSTNPLRRGGMVRVWRLRGRDD